MDTKKLMTNSDLYSMTYGALSVLKQVHVQDRSHAMEHLNFITIQN